MTMGLDQHVRNTFIDIRPDSQPLRRAASWPQMRQKSAHPHLAGMPECTADADFKGEECTSSTTCGSGESDESGGMGGIDPHAAGTDNVNKFVGSFFEEILTPEKAEAATRWLEKIECVAVAIDSAPAGDQTTPPDVILGTPAGNYVIFNGTALLHKNTQKHLQRLMASKLNMKVVYGAQKVCQTLVRVFNLQLDSIWDAFLMAGAVYTNDAPKFHDIISRLYPCTRATLEPLTAELQASMLVELRTKLRHAAQQRWPALTPSQIHQLVIQATLNGSKASTLADNLYEQQRTCYMHDNPALTRALIESAPGSARWLKEQERCPDGRMRCRVSMGFDGKVWQGKWQRNKDMAERDALCEFHKGENGRWFRSPGPLGIPLATNAEDPQLKTQVEHFLSKIDPRAKWKVSWEGPSAQQTWTAVLAKDDSARLFTSRVEADEGAAKRNALLQLVEHLLRDCSIDNWAAIKLRRR